MIMIKRTKKDDFKQVLTDHKLNINQLAERLGCEAQIVHSWFSRKGIPVKRCSQLIEIIGCSLDDLRPFLNGQIPYVPLDRMKDKKLPNLLLAERISSAMRASCKTIEQVVGEIGCSKTAYHKWVKTGHIDVNNIAPLALALDVHPFYFTEVITGKSISPPGYVLSDNKCTTSIDELSDDDLAHLLAAAATRLAK